MEQDHLLKASRKNRTDKKFNDPTYNIKEPNASQSTIDKYVAYQKKLIEIKMVVSNVKINRNLRLWRGFSSI